MLIKTLELLVVKKKKKQEKKKYTCMVLFLHGLVDNA